MLMAAFDVYASLSRQTERLLFCRGFASSFEPHRKRYLDIAEKPAPNTVTRKCERSPSKNYYPCLGCAKSVNGAESQLEMPTTLVNISEAHGEKGQGVKTTTASYSCPANGKVPESLPFARAYIG
jgi:hypothetical protein